MAAKPVHAPHPPRRPTPAPAKAPVPPARNSRAGFAYPGGPNGMLAKQNSLALKEMNRNTGPVPLRLPTPLPARTIPNGQFASRAHGRSIIDEILGGMQDRLNIILGGGSNNLAGGVAPQIGRGLSAAKKRGVIP